ncbi:rRNA maturation RNase YbeY [Aquicoccus porphyridii]|uniref:Endoribonuclease YbeY n=1 Tax=Aquicoccus porphyridii TaxID=1852029 RepID=A0A5A9ZSV2_9RHOB|nr:rRNA maturation RNase YbeY [Aquicoccus porphyridii]KAA0920408.1 rRNA maturation RNase YbeY [Aquicoccus porphyridii]RAI54806.1 rRNA maturation RNase YbeY [Rhodobacteraceae bacterium AsT-22]
MCIDLIIEDDRWSATALDRLAPRAARATLTRLGLDPDAHELCLMACDDTRIATLNADFRDKPRPTNVLSWPATDLAASEDGDPPALPEPDPHDPDAGFLGDIAIAYETCMREAAEQHKSPDDHVTHLVVHAILHCLGYDHMRDRDATLMERLEVDILGKLGIPDPYRDTSG